MNPLGLECLSVFGLHPVEFIQLAGELECPYVTLSLSRAPNRLAVYPEVSFRDDRDLQRRMITAAHASDVQIGLVEGFSIMPSHDVGVYERDLDMVAELGAKSICTVSVDKDLPRTYQQFNQLALMAAARGLTTTTEMGAGVLRDLSKAVAAIDAVANQSFKLLIDTMHFFRSGASVADLSAIDPASIGHIQLCDVPMPAVIDSYMEEALYERRAPGDGDLPLLDFLQVIPRDVIVGLEIPIRSAAAAGIGPRERLQRCVQMARALLQQADA